MDTRATLSSLSQFQSHHSGMEIELLLFPNLGYNRCFNRTIVEWKCDTCGYRDELTIKSFNRTIVEWKFPPKAPYIVIDKKFQSHHSGMEIRRDR